MTGATIKSLLVVTCIAMQVGLAHAAELSGDAKAGEKVFKKCKACHQVGPEAKSKVGPPLNGILGRTAGTFADFSYSAAMAAKSTGDDALVWTPETLDAFLAKPKKFLDGTKMTFAGLRKDKQRADIIAYLATFDEQGGS